MTRMPVVPLGKLTLALARVEPSASIQMYSAMMLPFWSSLRYLLSWRGHDVSKQLSPRRHGAVPASNLALTVSVREMIASAYNEQC